MLVLSRKDGECVVITPPGHPPIIVKIVEVRNGKVRLGVDAPPNVQVHRQEIQEKIQKALDKEKFAV